MTLAEIKKEMHAYRDFYGGDLIESSEIDKATSIKELCNIVDKQIPFMEAMLADAMSDLERFRKRLGLTTY